MLLFTEYAHLASALAIFHSRLIKGQEQATYIHYDIKPANILVFDRDGRISFRLGDLEDVKLVSLKTPTDSSLRLCGSSGYVYAAPEAKVSREARCRSDVFSLGALGVDLYVYYTYGREGVENFEGWRLHQLKSNDTKIPRFYSKIGETVALLEVVDSLLKEMEEAGRFQNIGYVLREMMKVDLKVKEVNGQKVPGRMRSQPAADFLNGIADYDRCRRALLDQPFTGYRIPPRSAMASTETRVDSTLTYPLA